MNKTILIVDDYPDALSIFKELFEMEGYIVVTANNGAEASACLLQHRPSLVVIDDDPAGISGVHLASQLKRLSMKNHYPIPAAIAFRGDVFKGVEPTLIGFDYVFDKPLNFDRLSVILNRCMPIRA